MKEDMAEAFLEIDGKYQQLTNKELTIWELGYNKGIVDTKDNSISRWQFVFLSAMTILLTLCLVHAFD